MLVLNFQLMPACGHVAGSHTIHRHCSGGGARYRKPDCEVIGQGEEGDFQLMEDM